MSQHDPEKCDTMTQRWKCCYNIKKVYELKSLFKVFQQYLEAGEGGGLNENFLHYK
jgi:hypothetical protein